MHVIFFPLDSAAFDSSSARNYIEHDRLIGCLTLGWAPKQQWLPLIGMWASEQSFPIGVTCRKKPGVGLQSPVVAWEECRCNESAVIFSLCLAQRQLPLGLCWEGCRVGWVLGICSRDVEIAELGGRLCLRDHAGPTAPVVLPEGPCCRAGGSGG